MSVHNEILPSYRMRNLGCKTNFRNINPGLENICFAQSLYNCVATIRGQ